MLASHVTVRVKGQFRSRGGARSGKRVCIISSKCPFVTMQKCCFSRLCFLRALSTRAAIASKGQRLRRPEKEDSRGPAPHGSRIYILDRRREPEVEVPEALRALRAYSLVESTETVEFNVMVDMTLKKVRINWYGMMSVQFF